MRGSPLLRAAITFLVLLGLAPLLWQMTRPGEPKESTTGPAKVEAAKVHLDLAFTTVPKRVVITHLEKVVWSKETPATREECDLEIPFPAEGVEIKFALEWAPEAPLSAMRVQLTGPRGIELERSVWGRGAVEKVLGFP